MARIGGTKFWETWIPHTIVAVALILGSLLAGTIGYLHHSVRQSSQVLVRGQATELVDAVHRMFGRFGQRPRPEDFDELLSELWPVGLRYVAVLGPDGGPETSAGTPAAPVTREALTRVPPLEPIVLGDRVRVHATAPPSPPPPGPERAGPGRAPGPAPLIIEFEPLAAAAVQAQVRVALWGALIAIPLFVAGGFFLAYVVRQRERLSRRLEQERRLAALGEMSAVIAHEIRNPLTSLKGHAQLLAESLAADPRASKAERVVNEAVRLQHLVSDLLDFARTGALDRQPVDPVSILREAIGDLGAQTIVAHTENAPAVWSLDAERLRQALANLLRNAVQASPDGGSVEATVAVSGRGLVFEVGDHGAGIPPGLEEKIFEPFQTGRARGTGLGLALVKRIVTQHGGEISVHNAASGGAVFRICIPGG